MMSILQDLLYGWRNLSKTPGFLVIAVLSLALGIGANTALFTLLYSALYRALPVDDPETLIIFNDPAQSGISMGENSGERGMMTWPEFQDLHQVQAMQGLFAAEAQLPRHHIRIGGAQEDATTKMVSGAYFSVLGIQPQIGRFFSEDADKSFGGSPYLVLSDDYWGRRFGRDPSVIGKSIVIQKTAFDIIGVAPRGFSGETVGQNPDFWLPLSMQMQVMPGMDFLHPYSDPTTKIMWLHVFGRLKPGVNLATAQTQASAIFKTSLEESYQSLSGEQKKDFMDQYLKLRPASTGASTLRTRFAESLYVIFAAVGAVLLICCANISNLLLARAQARQREMMVRVALGASKFRVVRQLFTEGLLLSSIGAACGLLLSQAIAPLLLRMASSGEDAIHLNSNVDWRVLAFTSGVTIVTTVICSLLPALRASRAQVGSTLRESGRGVTSSRRRLNTGRAFVAAQVALSVILLMGAGLFLRTLLNLENIDLGYSKDRLAMVNIDIAAAGYKPEATGHVNQNLLERLRALPGVKAVTYSMNGLFSGSESGDTISVEGYTPTGKDDKGSAFDSIGPNYFSALGIPLEQGREIDDRDVPNSLTVCVINDAFAKQFFAGRNPIGKHITDLYAEKKEVFEIVGVAKNSRDHSLRDKVRPRVFASFAQGKFGGRNDFANFEVRLAGDSGAALPELKNAVLAENSNIEVHTRFLAKSINEELDQERLVANFIMLFGGLALALAAIGIYGILAYGVTQRTNEIGVRMAIGAAVSDVVRMIATETIWMVASGLVIGLLASYFLTRLVESRLFGVTATDPAVVAAAAGTLALVGLIAATLPALKASRIDPAIALRDE